MLVCVPTDIRASRAPGSEYHTGPPRAIQNSLFIDLSSGKPEPVNIGFTMNDPDDRSGCHAIRV